MPHIKFIGPDGEAWASVTTILDYKPKPWLDRWKLKWGVLADRKTIASSNIGTDFHSGVEAFCDGLPFEPKYKRVGLMLEKFKAWATKVGLRVTEKELHVVSIAHRYHGSFDAVGYMKDKPRTLVLFDWKTSKGIKPDAKYQLVAYALAYFEETGIMIDRLVVVNVLKKKPWYELEVQEYKTTKALVKGFLKRVDEYYKAKEGL